jgi:ribulose-5-phosphate 4-epimerase/fuculose-1-phosphate aldolase
MFIDERKEMAPRVLKHLAVALFVCLAAATVRSQAPNAPTRQAVIDELVIANHILANEGVLDGYGHVSIRSPQNRDHYFLARAGAPALVTAADIVEYDFDSNVIGGSTAAGYMERFIHGEIYRARPDVMAVVHCHCPEVIPFANAGVPLRPMYHMGYFIGEGVPLFDNRTGFGVTDMLIGTPALGKALATALGKSSAALLRGHGAVVTATSLHLVVGKAYYLNLNARLQYQAMQLGGGKVTYLDPEEARKAEQNYERSWDAWKAALPARMSPGAR